MRILLPKVGPDFNRDNEPLPFFFLAGPVRGGGDWQFEMCNLIAKRLHKDFYAAVPCRWDTTHPSFPYRAKGVENAYPRQLDWERAFLKHAATRRPGCIIFWLPCESKSDPHPGPEPYAMDTRGELGEWRGRMMERDIVKHPRPRFVVGAEADFLGLSQIQRNFDQAIGFGYPNNRFPIYTSMAETAKAGVKLALSR